MNSMLPLLSSDEVVSRLAELVVPGAALAFDADGTLWSGDIGIDAFEHLLERRAVRPEAVSALRHEAESYGLTASGATEMARALYEAFASGVYPESPAFQMMAWVFAGYTEAEARDMSLEVVEKVGLAARLHPEILPVLRWATDNGVRVLVVSATSSIVIRAAVERLGIRASEVIGMSAAIENGVVAARVAPPIPYGPGKVEALRQSARGAKVIGAFGDSLYDLPMLCDASLGVTVRPKPELREKAAAHAELVELAPHPA
jgi:HAD superfamily phosphoserine phosphatase-like hydrolase